MKSAGKNANEIAKALWLVITENIKTRPFYFDKFLSLIVNSAKKEKALERLKILKECPNTSQGIAIALREKYQETSVMTEKEVVTNLNDFFAQYNIEKIKISISATVQNNDDLPF